jgi:hypothetical protein
VHNNNNLDFDDAHTTVIQNAIQNGRHRRGLE